MKPARIEEYYDRERSGRAIGVLSFFPLLFGLIWAANSSWVAPLYVIVILFIPAFLYAYVMFVSMVLNDFFTKGSLARFEVFVPENAGKFEVWSRGLIEGMRKASLPLVGVSVVLWAWNPEVAQREVLFVSTVLAAGAYVAMADHIVKLASQFERTGDRREREPEKGRGFSQTTTSEPDEES